MIDPIVLKGFRDSMPKQEMAKKQIIRKLEDIFTSFGFVAIDTPALEYTEVLLGKGGGETDKQIFHFQDNGKREVALRFDLTVPFARFLAGHYNDLAFPFKRFHINKVWRGENPQKGRFREFIQCDFDIVGLDNSYSDFEILSLMDASFKMLNVGNYTFHLAHRGLFNKFLETNGILENSVEILRTVDKLRKIGEDEVFKLFVQITNSEDIAKKILAFITKDENEDFLTTLARLEDLAGGECDASIRLKDVYSLLSSCGIAKHFILDPSITRGLDYYTGIVYETFLNDLPSIGSVCSGGRYDNLASLYTKQNIPGVGSSIGLDRLLAALEELDSPIVKTTSSADFIIFFEEEDKAKAFITANEIRSLGYRCLTYLAPGKKFKVQMAYSDKNEIKYVVNFTAEGYSIKNTITREVISGDNLKVLIDSLKEND